MSASVIRKKLLRYIENADEKKVRAFYTIVESEIETADRWQQDSFVEEMNVRAEALESGKVKGASWSDVKRKVAKKLSTAKLSK